MSFAYADDLTFMVKADGHGCALSQTVITIIIEWSGSMLTLLSNVGFNWKKSGVALWSKTDKAPVYALWLSNAHSRCY